MRVTRDLCHCGHSWTDNRWGFSLIVNTIIKYKSRMWMFEACRCSLCPSNNDRPIDFTRQFCVLHLKAFLGLWEIIQLIWEIIQLISAHRSKRVRETMLSITSTLLFSLGENSKIQFRLFGRPSPVRLVLVSHNTNKHIEISLSLACFPTLRKWVSWESFQQIICNSSLTNGDRKEKWWKWLQAKPRGQ